MLLPLLTTKLTVPPAALNLVERERLLKTLQAGLRYRVTLVTTPAGYGKTTLLSQWVIHPAFCPDHLVWFTLDERDNDPNRFWGYFFTALQCMQTAGSRVSPGMELLDNPMTEDMLAALVQQVIMDTPGECVLVMDDFHLITDSSILAMLAFLLQNLPNRLHLYLITRVEPPLPLAQLRVRGQLLELQAEDLRFTGEESQAFLTEVMGLELQPEDYEALNTRAEGWIAGLQLAALAIKREMIDGGRMTKGRAVSNFPRSSSAKEFANNNRLIEVYLDEQVLAQQTPVIKQFLLDTSILNTLTGPLCDALISRHRGMNGNGKSPKNNIHSTVLLERLKKENLFLAPLDNECRWYRYHPLFAAFLQRRLRETDLNRWMELHKCAAEWYEREGLQEEALRHALEGECFELAAHLIEQVAGRVYHRNEVSTTLSWIKALPEDILFSRPQLCLHYAWALALNGQIEAVEPVLEKVSAYVQEAGVPKDNLDSYEGMSHQVNDLLDQIETLRSYLARFNGKISDAISLSQCALDKTPANRPSERAIRLILLGRAQYLAGYLEAARRNLSEALQLTRLAGPELGHLSAIHYLAQLYQVQGRLHRAYGLYKDAEAYLANCEWPFLGGIEQVGLGELMCEWNNLEGAASCIHTGLRLAEQSGDYIFLRDACLACIRLEIARGQFDEADAALQRLETLVIHSRAKTDFSLLNAWQARLLLAQEDFNGLEGWIQTCGLSPVDELNFEKEFEHITLARGLLALGQRDEARPLIARLLDAAKAGQRKGRIIDLLLLQALLYYEEDKTTLALKALKSALTLAAPEGYLNTFLGYGASLAALTQSLCRSNAEIGYQPGWKGHQDRKDLHGASFPMEGFTETRYALRLMNEFASKELLRDSLKPGWTDGQPPFSPLSEREIQVLRLIAAGKSYQEISQELLVALSTVQTHVKHAYFKLDAHNGLEATARARQLNLIP